MRTREIIIHFCASLTFLYALWMSPGDIETIWQEQVWMMQRIFWMLVSISFEISLINLKGGNNGTRNNS